MERRILRINFFEFSTQIWRNYKEILRMDPIIILGIRINNV